MHGKLDRTFGPRPDSTSQIPRHLHSLNRRLDLDASPLSTTPISHKMFMQRVAVTAARRAAVAPVVARSFSTSFVLRTHLPERPRSRPSEEQNTDNAMQVTPRPLPLPASRPLPSPVLPRRRSATTRPSAVRFLPIRNPERASRRHRHPLSQLEHMTGC